MTEPILTTERLVLRPFSFDDVPDLRRLISAREIADGTLRIPHPYPDGAAEQWLIAHAEDHDRTGSVVLAITQKDDRAYCGTIGLHVEPGHHRAELGYWIGVPFWGRGYATEAASVMLTYGFTQMNLRRIFAMHYTRNPASGRVMQKLGMKYEGRLRQHVMKCDEFRDLDIYGMLADEWIER